RIDEDAAASTDARLQPRPADCRGLLHEALIALVLDLLRHRRGEPIGRRAIDRGVLEAPDAVDLRLVEPREQLLEFLLALTRKADDETAAQRQIGSHAPPRLDAAQSVLAVSRTTHAPQNLRTRVLKWNVEIGQHAGLPHQLDYLIDVRIGIDVMQAHPDTK